MFRKNSTWNVVLGVELSVAVTKTVGPSAFAEEMIGKFCRPFGPPSASPESLAVTPSAPRSMPSPPLSWIALPLSSLPVGVVLAS